MYVYRFQDPHQQLEHDLTNHAPDALRVAAIEAVRAYVKDLGHEIITRCPDSREKSLALTNLEQASMWAVASIARSVDSGFEPTDG